METGAMWLLEQLWTPEIRLGDFLVPWGMVISIMGFLVAWFAVGLAERLCWTRHIWHLPLFFVSLAVVFGCVFGLIFAP